MTDLTRRNFTTLAGASLGALRDAAVRARGARAGQAEAGRDRRRAGGGTVARYVNKDAEGRDRRHADRAADRTSPPASSPTSMSAAIAIFKSITHNYDKVRKERRAGRPRGRDRDRPRQEAGRARRRAAHALRPPGGRARHRPQVRIRCPAIRRPRRDHAARLEAGRADRSCWSRSSTRSRTATPS